MKPLTLRDLVILELRVQGYSLRQRTQNYTNGKGLTYKQIGEELGLTQERARQLTYRALKKVREFSGL